MLGRQKQRRNNKIIYQPAVQATVVPSLALRAGQVSFGACTMLAGAARRAWLLRLAFVALVIGAAWSTYAWYRTHWAAPAKPPPSSRTSQFLNTQSGVAYVGSASCGQCHPTEAATYAEHPMGRSVSPARRQLPAQPKAASSFDAAGLHYAVERRGEAVLHREALPRHGQASVVEIVAEPAFAIGSGRQGQSFVFNREGRLFQSPISWYVHANAWKLAPGFAQQNQHFNRSITESCLFCHCNEAHLKPDTINQFELRAHSLEPIGCERCHGPGELHVASQERGGDKLGLDHTIVNPRRLPPRLREAVCEQCHLQGEVRIVRPGASLWSYRPGLPLDDFVSVFVPASDGHENRKAVSHVEQMHQSRCYKASEGRMDCISCHDPHVLPPKSERVTWYRSRCLTCHQETACSLPVIERRKHTRADSCIECHMPQGDSSNIAHSSITDHRVVRRPERAAPERYSTDRPLVRFHAGMLDESNARRDLGIALAEVGERTNSESQRRIFARPAYTLVMPALERQPDDVAAWEARGQALWWDKRPREALDSLEKALKQAPQRELALRTAALVSLELNETERSIAYLDRVLAIDPYSWPAHAFRGQALALRQQWREAVDACDASLRLNPFESRTRMLLIDCLIHQGRPRRAREELQILLELRSSPPEQIQKWFDELLSTGLPTKK
jgi:hypothetical protein